MEKPDWLSFLETDTAAAYLSARYIVSEAAGKVACDDLSYVDEKFTIGFINNNFDEKAALKVFLSDKKASDIGDMKPYIPNLLDEFTGRIGGWYLEHYGWVTEDVTKAIIGHIQPEALKSYASFNIDKELDSILDGMNAKETQEFLGLNIKSTKYTVKEREQAEFDRFYAETMEKPPKEIFADNYKIRFYEEISEFLKYNEDEIEDIHYEALSEDGDSVLSLLYDYYLKNEYASINNYSDTADLIRDYTEYYHEDILIESQQSFMPVYRENLEYANAHNEVGAYNDSHAANMMSRDDIIKSINDNHDGTRLGKGFETGLIEKHGLERVAFLLANTLRLMPWDGRFSKENKEWAQSVSVPDDSGRSDYLIEAHPVLLDAVTTRIRKMYKENKKDLEAKDMAETKPDNKTFQPKIDWQKARVSKQALIERYENHSFLRMPSSGDYARYTYNIYNNRIKEGRYTDDLQSDSKSLCLEILLKPDETVRLSNHGDEVVLSAAEFIAAVDRTFDRDYERVEREFLSIKIPQEAMLGMYEKSALFRMPKSADIAGYSFYIPNSMIEEDAASDDGTLEIRLPDNFSITAKNRETEETLKLTASQLSDYFNNTAAADFAYERDFPYAENSSNSAGEWSYTSISGRAVIDGYEGSILFRMPKGEYEGFGYYLPDRLVNENKNGTFRLSLPKDFIVRLTEYKTKEKVELNVEQFLSAIKGKTDEDYASFYGRPSEEKMRHYLEREELLKLNVPEEMRNRPNWCIVRTRENPEKGRLDKFLIDCHTGKFARSDDPATWTDFETATAKLLRGYGNKGDTRHHRKIPAQNPNRRPPNS